MSLIKPIENELSGAAGQGSAGAAGQEMKKRQPPDESRPAFMAIPAVIVSSGLLSQLPGVDSRMKKKKYLCTKKAILKGLSRGARRALEFREEVKAYIKPGDGTRPAFLICTNEKCHRHSTRGTRAFIGSACLACNWMKAKDGRQSGLKSSPAGWIKSASPAHSCHL